MKLFSMPMYDADATAAAAPAVTVQVPTADQLATMTQEDLAKLKADLEAAASVALSAVEEAEAKAAKEVKALMSDAEVAEQTFCQQHSITVQALNTWAAVLVAVLLIKLL